MPRTAAPLTFDPGTGPRGYSRAVRVGSAIHVSGITSLQRDRTVAHPGDPAGQARFILARIEEALDELGASLADVVRIRTYVADMSRWRQVQEVLDEVFASILPAATIVGAQLAYPDLLVEIEADAIVED